MRAYENRKSLLLFQKLLEAIKCHASKLSTLNAVIHRFTLDNQDSNDYVDSPLKAAVLELYEQFENARTM